MYLFVLLVVLVSAVLIYLDADRLRREKSMAVGPGGQSPLLWGLGAMLLWIVVVPWYLVVRDRPEPQQTTQRSVGAQAGRGCLIGAILLIAVFGGLFLLARIL